MPRNYTSGASHLGEENRMRKRAVTSILVGVVGGMKALQIAFFPNPDDVASTLSLGAVGRMFLCLGVLIIAIKMIAVDGIGDWNQHPKSH